MPKKLNKRSKKKLNKLFKSEQVLAEAKSSVLDLLISAKSKLGYGQIMASIKAGNRTHLTISDPKKRTKTKIPFKLIKLPGFVA